MKDRDLISIFHSLALFGCLTLALISPAHTETYCGRLCQDLEERLEDYSGTNPYGLELLFPHELPEGASKYNWDARNNNVIYVIVNNGPFTPDDPPLNKHVFDMHLFEDIHVPVNGPERYGCLLYTSPSPRDRG